MSVSLIKSSDVVAIPLTETVVVQAQFIEVGDTVNVWQGHATGEVTAKPDNGDGFVWLRVAGRMVRMTPTETVLLFVPITI